MTWAIFRIELGGFVMSFHEKSAWACLLGIGLIYFPYFVVAFSSPPAALGLFWLAAAGLAALLVGFHCLNAVATRSVRTLGQGPPLDELEQKIELRAAKFAGFILAFAVMSWILVAQYGVPVLARLGKTGADHSISVIAVLAAIHWLFAGFVVANLAYYGAIVFGYRRIARA